MMPPWNTGGKPSGFSRTIRICSSLWRPATYKAAKARGRPMGCRRSMAPEWRTRFNSSPICSASIPASTAAHFTLGNIYANEQRFREAADEYRVVDPPAIRPIRLLLLPQVKALVDVTAYH